MEEVNATCTAAEESGYSCDSISSSSTTDCSEDVDSDEALWSDRSYYWIDAPDDIMNTFHTYVQVPLETGEGAPCSAEGGFEGTLASDATIAICCANHCGSD